MKKIDLLYGFLMGIVIASIGVYLFIVLVTDYHFLEGFSVLKQQGKLGKLIALGAVLNIATFFFLLRFNKDLMARGVVLATILLTIITLFA